MNDIEICEYIAKFGCADIDCCICPLLDGKFVCNRYFNHLSAAKAYLKHHKKENTMTREEAFIAMVRGELVQPLDNKSIVCFYDENENNPFRVKRVDVKFSDKMNISFSFKKWVIYRETTKIWQFAYKSQGNANNIVGEVSKHMTEEKAKEKYGDNCIKLEWTEKEVEM